MRSQRQRKLTCSGSTLYYEDQQHEAARAAETFRQTRIPKFAEVRHAKCRSHSLQYFNSAIQSNVNRCGVYRAYGERTSIADLCLYQVLSGLHFAFPQRMKALDVPKTYHALATHYDELSRDLYDYLNSPRRRPFSDGLFRHYPELDAPQ